MKRYALTIVLVLALVVPLAACAQPAPAEPTTAAVEAPEPTKAAVEPPEPTAGPSAAAPVNIVFWHDQQDDSFRGKLLKEMCDRFHQEHPNITVEPVFVGNYDDLYTKSMAAIQAGNPPDLAVAYESYIAEFMAADAVVPLDPYINDPEIGLTEEDRTDIFPGYWETNVFPEFGGQMLSFPFTKSALAMYYNMTALREAGINEVPKTWDEFEAACQAVSRGNVVGLAWHESASTFDGFLYSRGVDQLNESQTEAIFNGPEGVEALELLLRLEEAGASLKPEGNYADQAMFAQGNAVFTFGSTSDTLYYATASGEAGSIFEWGATMSLLSMPAWRGRMASAGSTFEWGATMIPQADASRPPRTVMYGANICIFKTDEAKQRAAWQFIKWFTDTEQTAEWGTQSGYTPIRESAMKQLEESGWLDDNPVIKQVYETVIPYSYPEPNVRGEQEIRTFIEDAWTSALSGLQTPQEALDEAVAKANEALASKQ
jgi:multiple sugar transport system substrate-binding protein